jgi:hypothetical protein
MVCIWSTSVRLTWGVASLRSILLNMHTWASRVLKPKIQACVYQVSRYLELAAPRAPLSTYTDNSDKPLWTFGFKAQSATGFTSTTNIKMTSADVTDLTKAFGSSSLADSGKPINGSYQHCDTAGNLKKSTKWLGFGSSPKHRSENMGLFGEPTPTKTNQVLFGGPSTFGSTNTAVFGDPHLGKSKELFEHAMRSAKPRLSDCGSTRRFGCVNDHPVDLKADNNPSCRGVCNTPGVTLEATGKPRNPGTTRRAFSPYRERDGPTRTTQEMQTITFHSPYQDYSLEELRLADYAKGHRYDESSEEEGNDNQSVETDDLGSEEDSNSDPDSGECDHSDPDDCSCQPPNSIPEDDTECDDDSEPDASDRDDESDSDASDLDASTTKGKFWMKQNLKGVLHALQSQPLSGERRMDWTSLELITRALGIETRVQVFRLADEFRSPFGICSVPLERIVRLLKHSLKELRKR